MVLTLQEMGFEIEASHHEVAPGQHEIDFKYIDNIADRVITFYVWYELWLNTVACHIY